MSATSSVVNSRTRWVPFVMMDLYYIENHQFSIVRKSIVLLEQAGAVYNNNFGSSKPTIDIFWVSIIWNNAPASGKLFLFQPQSRAWQGLELLT